jgi:glycosyltransferase involved in cell wall biosynthesis
MNKNILWLASWYPSALAPYDGDFIQRHAQAVARFQKITVIYIKKDEDGVLTKDIKTFSAVHNNLNELIVFYHPVKTGLRFLNRLLSSIKYKKVYREVLKKYIREKGKPDLVHVHVALKAGIQALFLKGKLRVPYIVTEHWTGYHKAAKINIYNSGFLFRKYTEKVLSNASLFLPVTKKLGEVINNSITKIPYEVTGNVVDTGLFYYKPRFIPKFRFIHASSLNYQKNPEGIIRSVKQLAEEGLNFELIIIGSITKELIDLADSLSLTGKYIIFRSSISYAEVAKEMQDASSLVLFSRIENVPCIISEALCCGLPIISSDVGGIHEIVNESNGILVESENEDQLTCAMKEMIIKFNSYNKIEIAKKASNEFSYETIGKKISGIYKKMLDSTNQNQFQ